jgi:putative nucleotidyltransferase with HDIG domain
MGELEKVLKLGKLKQAIRLMDISGLLHYVLPEVQALKKVSQPEKYHQEGDVYRHTLKTLENAKPGIENQLAALLHDIGKPSTRSILNDEIHFYSHEDVSAEMTKAIMQRLRFDNDTTDRVVKMVRNHMRPHSLTDAKETALRRFIRDIGDEMVDSILELAKADELGSLPNTNLIPDLMDRIKAIREAPVKTQAKAVLSGDDIMEALSIKPGPKIKEVQQYLLGVQDEHASQGKELTKEEALELIRKKYL